MYTDVKDSGINLTVRYLTDPRRRRGTAEIIWERTLEAFGENDNIDFAYPTIRYYDNKSEGKSYPGEWIGLGTINDLILYLTLFQDHTFFDASFFGVYQIIL